MATSETNDEADVDVDTVKLATFEISTGSVRPIRAEEMGAHLVYGLDDGQFMRVIRQSQYPGHVAAPPNTVPDPQHGLPLRPLYVDLKSGTTKRAVPISWTEGRPYKPS